MGGGSLDDSWGKRDSNMDMTNDIYLFDPSLDDVTSDSLRTLLNWGDGPGNSNKGIHHDDYQFESALRKYTVALDSQPSELVTFNPGNLASIHAPSDPEDASPQSASSGHTSLTEGSVTTAATAEHDPQAYTNSEKNSTCTSVHGEELLHLTSEGSQDYIRIHSSDNDLALIVPAVPPSTCHGPIPPRTQIQGPAVNHPYITPVWEPPAALPQPALQKFRTASHQYPPQEIHFNPAQPAPPKLSAASFYASNGYPATNAFSQFASQAPTSTVSNLQNNHWDSKFVSTVSAPEKTANKNTIVFMEPEVPIDFVVNPNNHGRWKLDSYGNRTYLNAPKVKQACVERK
ncbi:hypothetical protein N7532_008186 [Penicillium argentinense]|uniref:Uncharacterized protein n=1 Tax=Penicillium argentinense TaxID=1131581 RepID=A0A9W9EWX9_9EURO|nr:uncharacterized protein N7532_008186 [Penicillium argentinense]KAJ5089502.1 hypothetical protein N7532_008186 [Penicillium argentinense]